MGLLSDIERLNQELDERSGDRLLRYMLADALEESAGTVECAVCGGDGRSWPGAVICGICCGTGGDGSGYTCMGCGGDGQRHPPAVKCDRCSGTGRVSDGRRERAEGYRVLAQLDRVPWQGIPTGGWFYSDWTMSTESLPNSGPDRSELPVPWLKAIGLVKDSLPGSDRTRLFPTRREAEDAAALAWGTLPDEVRARILKSGK